MKISISGTHCTGKSTLIDILKKEESLNDFIFLKSSTREVLQYGLTINEQGSNLGQLYMVSQDYINLIKNKDKSIISDRCVLDTFIYSQYLFNKGILSGEVLKTIRVYLEETIFWYDRIFIIRPEFSLVSDGVRSLNNQYRDEIDYLFQKFIQGSIGLKISYLTGSTEQRVEQFKAYLNE